MNKDKLKNFTVIENKKDETETVSPKNVYQSNPLKTSLYAKFASFCKSQKKFSIKDVIQDSLK